MIASEKEKCDDGNKRERKIKLAQLGRNQGLCLESKD